MRQTEFDEPEFLARLRRGEEQAYRALIRRFHGSLIGVAASIIGSRAQAEEVVQDAWLAVFSGIGRLRGPLQPVTWVFSIVLNRARTRATREGRLVGLPALMEGTPPGRPGGGCRRSSSRTATGSRLPACGTRSSPERIVGGRQLWDHVMEAIDRLPAGQRAVIILRDIEGCEAEEACTLLGISAENQRVLLHRARGRIRQTIDALIGEPRAAAAPAAARRRRDQMPRPRRGGRLGKVGWRTCYLCCVAGSLHVFVDEALRYPVARLGCGIGGIVEQSESAWREAWHQERRNRRQRHRRARTARRSQQRPARPAATAAQPAAPIRTACCARRPGAACSGGSRRRTRSPASAAARAE